MSQSTNEHTINTDVLIVGAGPAGASLACFLAYYGIQGLMITKDKHSATQPRAHMTNMATLECLRDIGLEDEWRTIGMSKAYYGDQRFAYTVAGPDIIRQTCYGCEPQRMGDYEEASPCEHIDVSQNIGEPILHKYATFHDFDLRFNSDFLTYTEDTSTGLITSTIVDQLTGERFRVISKYLCGADGAGSKIATQAGITHSPNEPLGAALNVWYEADLSHLYKNAPSMLSVIFNPSVEAPDWAVNGMHRVVKPYSEFVMSMMAAPGVTSIDVSEAQVVTRLREMIGDDSVEIKVKGIYRWRLNQSYAHSASNAANTVFSLGDAIHRHTPGKGLGMNTSIQDAYNLAWKLAFVLKGHAGPKLLASYSAERTPTAKFVVEAANDTLYKFRPLMAALGLDKSTVEARMKALKELGEATTAGAERRAALKLAHKATWDAKSALGAEMNQAYRSGAVYLQDEEEKEGDGEESEDYTHHHVSTKPGARLPHAWLGKTANHRVRLSTQDVAGKGRFVLFTGIGGEQGWKRAAKRAVEELGGIEIDVRSVGFGQEFEDMYCKWEERRGVEEDGAVLVRPDRTVAWRCKSLESLAGEEKLAKVMRAILGRD